MPFIFVIESLFNFVLCELQLNLSVSVWSGVTFNPLCLLCWSIIGPMILSIEYISHLISYIWLIVVSSNPYIILVVLVTTSGCCCCCYHCQFFLRWFVFFSLEKYWFNLWHELKKIKRYISSLFIITFM